MKIRFLGHAAFELTFENGQKAVFDPYESGAYDGALAYGPIEGEFDYAFVSHDHADHYYEGVASKAERIVNSAGEYDFGEVRVRAVATYHDETKGSERGSNLIMVIEAEGLRLAHLGDLGHALPDELAAGLKGVDVLLVPVGGHFTIDAPAAAAVVEKIDPRIVIPMHFKTDKVDFPIDPVDRFTALMADFEEAGGSEITVSSDDLPEGRKVVVLTPAL
jgi:L-ascorbate metabolism protein UlaG (beta-lactamase superfamily)